MAERLGIDYIEVTPYLVAESETKIISSGSHFNEIGHSLYTILLAEEIRMSYDFDIQLAQDSGS